MHENEYAYAVARIRANEVNLLTPAETEQLISAESYEAALRLLGDKGWHTDGVGHDYAPMLEEHVNAAWQLLKESAPDASFLDALVINNDFFNLKAALKAKFSDLDPSDYVVKPSVWDPAEIIGCVERNELDSLPECMRDCAQAAYDAIVKLETFRRKEIHGFEDGCLHHLDCKRGAFDERGRALMRCRRYKDGAALRFGRQNGSIYQKCAVPVRKP